MFGNKFVAYIDQQKTQFKDKRLDAIIQNFNSKRKGEELFTGKRILEIGCHVGQTSLQFAASLNPAIVIGVDIDPRLIKNAQENVHYLLQNHS